MGSVIGKLTGADKAAKASSKAAESQVQAQRDAIAAQERAFQQVAPGLAQFLSPYRQQAFIPAVSLGEQKMGQNPFLNPALQQASDAAVQPAQGQVPGQPQTRPNLRGRARAYGPTGMPIRGTEYGGGPTTMDMPASTQARPITQPAGGFGGMPAGGAQYDPLTQLRAASGALGPEAQAQFYQNFQEDPGTAFLREQGLRDINRQASASGGLGGASRLKAMTQFSQGLANQQLQQRLGQLGGLAQTDIGLATGLGNLRTGLGSATAQGLSNIGAAQAQGQQAAGQAGQQGFQNLLGLGGIAAGFFSDDRLKKYRRKIGDYGKMGIYEWQWTDEAKALVGDQPSVGLLASEAEIHYPEAVTTDAAGWRHVDYSLIPDPEVS